MGAGMRVGGDSPHLKLCIRLRSRCAEGRSVVSDDTHNATLSYCKDITQSASLIKSCTAMQRSVHVCYKSNFQTEMTVHHRPYHGPKFGGLIVCVLQTQQLLRMEPAAHKRTRCNSLQSSILLLNSATRCLSEPLQWIVNLCHGSTIQVANTLLNTTLPVPVWHNPGNCTAGSGAANLNP
jgi:hypothetical protein